MRRAWGDRGFTLVEVLVVMALLSLIVVAMASALRTVGQSQDGVDRILRRTDDMRVATDFIRLTLSRVSAQKRQELDSAASIFFEGNRSTVAWLGVMPARYGSGGRYWFRLALEDDGARNVKVLRLRFIPWTQESIDWDAAESRVLADNVMLFKLRYEDISVAPAAWGDVWTKSDSFPSRVAIDLAGVNEQWPSLILAIRVMPSSLDSDGEFSVGGGRR